MRFPAISADAFAASATHDISSTEAGLGEHEPRATPAKPNRRGVLAAAAAAGLAPPSARDAAGQAAPAAPAPRMARPAAGDVLVFAAGNKSGKPIGLSDLEPGGPQVLAWAMEPGSGVVRNGSRLNQVVLVRLDPAALDETTASRAAEGVVAYSAVCTHAQCPVSEWKREKDVLHCPCHQSEFDPKRGGKVVGGPAQRPLAALPVKLGEGAGGTDSGGGGVLTVARPFVGRVGASSS